VPEGKKGRKKNYRAKYVLQKILNFSSEKQSGKPLLAQKIQHNR
jgi:hypothetical protein